MSQNEQKLGDLLRQFVQSKPIKDKYLLEEIKSIWNANMGTTIAQYTSEMKFRNGILTLKISSAPLRQELLYGKPKLLSLLNEDLPGDPIKDIRIY